MRIEIKPNSFDCPLRLSFGCGTGEYKCEDCRPGLYDLIPVAEVEGMRAEIAKLQGIINADDERLRAAEVRVFGDSTWGCDAADAMADKVLELRAENERLRKALKDIARPSWLMRTTDEGAIVRCTACWHRAPINGREMERAYEDIIHSDICPVAIARAALEGKP